MPKALVIGLGMGKLYAEWLTELGYLVVTVDGDLDKNAHFLSVESAINSEKEFDLAYIGTPNWTHESIARTVAPCSKLVLVEKPGVKSSRDWAQLVADFPDTKIMMVKNNQYRPEIERFKQLADQSNEVYIRWNNKNRIPNPGSWFTETDKSFGGVSRDLLPHMLSYYCVLTDRNKGVKQSAVAMQHHVLSDITSTDYGVVNPDGVYDVDDYCKLEFLQGKTRWVLVANWKDDNKDDSSISFDMASSALRIELGLCPKEAYQTMINTAMDNLNNPVFWEEQLAQDTWIHQQIETL